ncbi:MAG: hypothetical protein HY866_09915 [Chloroflexi bacterium]|nr:hypothetical protein [Chloroflexota bacterium]
MNNQALSYETILDLVLRLPKMDRARLIAQIAPTLVDETAVQQPIQALRGLLSDYGTAPSAEDIDEARREMWSAFPHEDI